MIDRNGGRTSSTVHPSGTCAVVRRPWLTVRQGDKLPRWCRMLNCVWRVSVSSAFPCCRRSRAPPVAPCGWRVERAGAAGASQSCSGSSSPPRTPPCPAGPRVSAGALLTGAGRGAHGGSRAFVADAGGERRVVLPVGAAVLAVEVGRAECEPQEAHPEAGDDEPRDAGPRR